jgi:hypothetical protein
MQATKSTEVKTPSLTRAVIFSLLLVLIDAIWLNQGSLALVVGVFVLLVGLPRSLLRKFSPTRLQRLRILGIYLSAAVLVFGLNYLNNQIAQSRAVILVSAVKNFYSENKHYPQSLNDLVPRYIEQIPSAKYTLMFNQFGYVNSERGAYLEYTEVPPFGRVSFSFNKDQWLYID